MAKRKRANVVLKQDEPIKVTGNPSAYLTTMPSKVLFGEAKGIVKWCRERGKAVPTLLDLERARHLRKREGKK